MKISTSETKNEIKMSLKITIANFSGHTQHAVKISTCHQDKNARCVIPGINVRSNTSNVHPSVTPSAAPQLKHRLCPHEGI